MKRIVKIKENELNKLIVETINKTIMQYNMLNEGMSSILYHFTSLENGFNIAKNDVIYLQSAYAKDSDNFDKKRKFYLSCTRIYSSQFGYSKKFSHYGGVRIVLDGDKLANNFKGKQINYWGGGVFKDKYKYYEEMPKNKEEFNQRIQWELNRFKKEHPDATPEEIQNFISHNFNQDAQHHVDNESEDRIFSYQPKIQNAHEYIKSIDVLIPELEQDEQKKIMAYSFKFNTTLGKYVRIFNSTQQFDSPKGKEIDNETLMNYYDYNSNNIYNGNDKGNAYRKNIYALTAVIAFITTANPKYEGKNFGPEIAKLLKKYELSDYNKEIGNMQNEINRMYSFQSIAERLDSVRRDLSDKPNEITSKIIKMLTDYLLSIGANSFREGYKIKKQIADEYYGSQYNKVYDRIKTDEKIPFLTLNKHIVIPNPNKTLFKDITNWDNDYMKYYADTIAYEVMNYNDYSNSYNKSSKNINSMFQFLYKLFRKATVKQTLDAFQQIGLTQDYIKNTLNLNFETKQLDYWDISNYDTPNIYQYKQNNPNYDYMKVSKQKG